MPEPHMPRCPKCGTRVRNQGDLCAVCMLGMSAPARAEPKEIMPAGCQHPTRATRIENGAILGEVCMTCGAAIGVLKKQPERDGQLSAWAKRRVGL